MMMSELSPVGLGTWENEDPDQCAASVRNALEMGYRHIDTARFYGNEVAVGAGIAAASVPRDEIFLASKLHPFAEGLAYDEVYDGVRESLDLLDLDALDLLYVHWPVGNYDPTETLRAFDDLVADGVTRYVGVSNFSAEMIETAQQTLKAPLFAHQAERHPLLPRDDLVTHARDNDYTFVAYSPLGRGHALSLPEIESIAAERGISPAVVSLAWVTAPDNVVAVPKATGTDHLEDNLSATEVTLSTDEIERINAIDRRERFVDRDGAPWK